MSDIPFPTNLLPGYQSPQAMAASAAGTANTQAGTQLLQQQTQGAGLANQRSAIQLGLLQNYLNGSATPAPGGAAPSPSATAPASDTVGGTNIDPGDVTGGMIAKFAPLPTARPPAVTAQMGQAAMAGLPEVAQNIGAQYDSKVALANQQRQLGANAVYQMAEQVANAPPGAAFETFNRFDPNKAAAFKAQHPSDDPAQLDADARLLAQHSGIAVHQYTGRDTDFQNGVLVDKKDGKPVLGSQQVLTGLDAGGKEKAFASANELVTVNNGLRTVQIPRWQQAGFHSAEGYVIAADKSARSTAASPPADASGNTSATVGPPIRSNPAVAAPASGTADPALKGALADPDYKLKTPTFALGSTATPGQIEQDKATVAARTDLLKDSNETTDTASKSLQYLQAAKAVLQSNGVTVGMAGPVRAEISRAAQALGFTNGVDATNFQEIAKYLGNAALQGGKAGFGKNFTQKEVALQMDELSPSTKMTPDALNNLIDSNIRASQYAVDSSHRVRPYLASGGDPQSFADWNQKYFDRSKAVNAAPARPGQQNSGPAVPTASGPNGQKLYLRNGQWVPQ